MNPPFFGLTRLPQKQLAVGTTQLEQAIWSWLTRHSSPSLHLTPRPHPHPTSHHRQSTHFQPLTRGLPLPTPLQPHPSRIHLLPPLHRSDSLRLGRR